MYPHRYHQTGRTYGIRWFAIPANIKRAEDGITPNSISSRLVIHNIHTGWYQSDSEMHYGHQRTDRKKTDSQTDEVLPDQIEPDRRDALAEDRKRKR
jgi:hypothetical protein